MDANELELLKKLHGYIFQTIFNFNNFDLNFIESSFGGFIIILKKLNDDTYDINWSYMEEIAQNINLTVYDYILKTGNSEQIINQIVHIINPSHPNPRRPYRLNSICKDLTPLSPFPTQKYKNYKEYHEKYHKLETVNDDQNLVELKSIDSNINLIQTNIKKFKGTSKIRLLFISEHIKLLGFKQDVYNQLRLIPSSLYRINSMLNVARLKILIESDEHFIKLHEKIRQPKFEELSWNKSIKFHKIKEDEQEKQKKKNNDDLFDDEEFNSIEIPDEIEEKLNEMIIEICSKAHKECYESSVDMSSSLIDDDDKISIYDDEELFNNNDDYDQDLVIADLTEKLNKLHSNDDTIMSDPVPKFLIIENQITKYEIPSNDENNVQEFPNVYELLQCLTLKSSNDSFDLERYEILGDCFLKLNTSLYIYCMFKGTNEGNLTYLKSHRVSNRNLYKLAAETELNNYVMGDGFRVHDNWLPPNFCLKKVEGNEKTKSCTIQSISDKSLADCIEALLGVYLIKCGTGAARAFLTWLGFIISKAIKTDFTQLIELPNPLLTDIGLDKKFIELKFASFEDNIGYKFRDIIYLFQAFTHPSYMSNRFTGSYQRLEFIGDAVLDLLVTQYLFNDEKEHSPGELTDLRQALVNNKFFAHLSIKHNFHKYLSYESKNMFGELEAYIKMQKKYTPNNAYFNSHLVFLISLSSLFVFLIFFFFSLKDFENIDDDDDDETIDDCDTPKFLADIFESVAGAIFLDSGCSLSTVWNVYYRMFDPYFSELPAPPLVSFFNNRFIFLK